ncbi:hypothetical protein K440DRAFT_605246 [Wilcoxina mikolae CBS 423.85]|nr:hypothetical protein K440DRAFT_605246 [Wilcoxina mikolae CBS 423.85]
MFPRPLLSLFKPLRIPNKHMATMQESPRLNVLHRPLQLHSTSPVTGYLRDGFCHAPPSDPGNHSIAAVLTPQFLKFSAEQGNDLTSIGLTGGCKWCLCVNRWKEAVDAFRRGEIGEETVPRVVVEATGRRALEGVVVDELRKWEV